jgi:chorismate--pyruvate lyase
MKIAPQLHWKKQYTLSQSAVSTSLQAWLLHAGSFMRRLKEKGIPDARIKVVSQEWQHAEPWENKLLNVESDALTLVREVLIVSEKKCWMFARSVFPRETLTGDEAELANLNTRPLGTVLFNHPEMKRSEFSYTCLRPGMDWHQKVANHLHEYMNDENNKLADFWSRYSLFQLHEKSLLLTEIFLPDMTAL